MYFISFIYALYVIFIAVLIYVIFRIINYWVDKNIAVKKEQNELLAKLISVLEKKKDE